MRIAIVVGLGVALALGLGLDVPAAFACGFPEFEPRSIAPEPPPPTEVAVALPILELAGGNATTLGSTSFSGAIGYAWGTRELGMFAGSTVERVLFHERHAGGDNALALTYGWYESWLASAGVDVGVETLLGDKQGTGPTARVMFGLAGIGVQLTGTVAFGSQTEFVGAGELVVDVIDLTGRL